MKNARVLPLALVLVLLFSFCAPAFAATEGETVTITILETSDIHGMIFPHDYSTDLPTTIGLAKAYTIVKAERELDPELVLVENGDSSQGNLIQIFRTEEVPPVIKAMNMMGYDLSVLGNHEFNYEFEHLVRSIDKRDAKVLAANIYNEADGTLWQEPYHIMDIKGVKVGFFGFTAPHIDRWESDPSHYQGLYFTGPMEATGKVLDELEGKCDLIIGVAHYGETGEYEYANEGMYDIAAAYADRIDGLMIGHAHSTIAETLDCGVPLVSPGYQGANVAKLTYEMKFENGAWVKVSATPEVLPTRDIEPDAELMAELQYVHDKSVEVANTVVGQIGETFLDPREFLPGIPAAAIADSSLIDLINKVQLEASGADVSLAALFDVNSNLIAGDFKNKDGMNAYRYENTLYAVKVTGADLKAIMQVYAGDFFNTFTPGDVTISFRSDVRLYNYDMFAGVDYEIDISKPLGERIVNVMYKGEPLADEQELVLALNNYRYGGLTADGLISTDAEIVYDSAATEIAPVRDMITAYVTEVGTIYPETDNNWKIVGYDFSDPQKDLIYDMVRNGEIAVEASADGRTPNVVALNGPALRAAGVLPALPGEDPAPAPVPPAPVPVDPMPQPVVPPSAEGEYTVVAGDNLWKIADKTLGDGAKWSLIYEANRDQIRDPNVIYIGQKLRIA
jgi:5''-nucleotidase/2'',3''-cyclic phosphodiesterase and related esterases